MVNFLLEDGKRTYFIQDYEREQPAKAALQEIIVDREQTLCFLLKNQEFPIKSESNWSNEYATEPVTDTTSLEYKLG